MFQNILSKKGRLHDKLSLISLFKMKERMLPVQTEMSKRIPNPKEHTSVCRNTPSLPGEETPSGVKSHTQ